MAEIITVERRRRWSDADKARIVSETFEPGASVSDVARRHGIHSSQLFAWRKLARGGGLRIDAVSEVRFAPVVVDPKRIEPPFPPANDEKPSASRAADVGRMEVVIGRGRRIIVFADVDAEALARVLGILEQR